jgi:hypothetical protein
MTIHSTLILSAILLSACAPDLTLPGEVGVDLAADVRGSELTPADTAPPADAGTPTADTPAPPQDVAPQDAGAATPETGAPDAGSPVADSPTATDNPPPLDRPAGPDVADVPTDTGPVRVACVGRVCPVPTNAEAFCAGSACAWRCLPGFADCDGASTNGCETDTRASVGNCGACGAVCPARSACTEGVCACTAPAVACGTGCYDATTRALRCSFCGRNCHPTTGFPPACCPDACRDCNG